MHKLKQTAIELTIGIIMSGIIGYMIGAQF